MDKVLLFFLFITIYSCSGNNDGIKNPENENLMPRLAKDSIYKLIDQALNQGDTKAYNKVSYYFLIKDMHEDFLYPAIIMANKHNSPEACYHVYQILNGVRNNQTLDLLDYKTKNMAIYYLLKSYELGNKDLDLEIELLQIFPKKEAIPKSSYYWNKHALEEN